MKETTQHRPKPLSPRADEAGMTLIEVMIAASVLILAFLLVMGSILSISTTSEITEDRTMAVAAASSVVEELRGLPFEEVMAYQPPTAEGLPLSTGVNVVCFDDRGEAYSLPLNPDSLAEPLPNPMAVQVTVFWQDKVGRPYSSRVSALLGR